MRKLKKMDTQVGQTVYSFKCPCGSCAVKCYCEVYNVTEGVQTRINGGHQYNVSHGGSAIGGAG
ncbi:hypothetical protein C806_04656 [Lachnospiraceae bacterium 3-1]|nr:hypothetical protein C806_04656 [Lachnospiraceae bacterium 3-1]